MKVEICSYLGKDFQAKSSIKPIETLQTKSNTMEFEWEHVNDNEKEFEQELICS